MMGDESGSADPALLKTLAGAGSGAIVGSAADPDQRPVRGGIVGAILGGAFGAGGVRGVLKARRSAMLSGLALPKSLIGNAGALGSEVLEQTLSGQPRTAARIVKEALRPGQYMKDVGEAFNGEARTATKAMDYAPESGPLSWIGRAMGSTDAAGRKILTRAGVPEAKAEEAMLTNTPRSRLGRFYVNGPEEGVGRDVYNEALPFRKIATNIVERGLERTPIVGQFYRADRATTGRKLAEQIAGGGAMYAGSQIDTSDMSPAERGILIAALGRYSVPFALGAGGTRLLLETMPETAPVQGVQAGKSVGENAKYLLKRYFKSYVPPDLR